MAPRIVGVDGRRQRGELSVQALGVGPLALGHPRGVVTDVDALFQAPGHLAGVGDIAVLDGKSQLGDELAVGGVLAAEDLAPGLHGAAIGQRDRLNAATGSFARLEYDHISTGAIQITRRRKPRQPGPEHCDVGHGQLPPNASRLTARRFLVVF